jgi:diguanylate cyclase (GGDEF)-like protein
VNDSLGHAMGDALLCEFAARLTGCVRPGDTVGRLGGDEFAVIVLTPADNFNASKVAARIGKALQKPFTLGGQDVLVTTSIGVASYPVDTREFETLLHYADTAMYEAKVAGRKSFRCYNPAMKERAMRKSDIQSALRLALDRGEFVLHYQPKMRVDGGQLSSVEALLRWNRPEYGLVAPGDFVPALEEMGLIVPVGTWVVETACRQIRKWQKAGLGDIRIAVNVSPKQVREELFIAHVAEAIRNNRIDPALLEFEITETTLMAPGESTDVALRSLKALGITISIDDFGTGYSNLAYLKRFQVDALKIDMGFIHDITTNADSATIAVAIINMAHNLRLKVIAEGVETQEQLEFLREHGCDEAQGFFFSRALPEAELSQRYRQAIGIEAEHDAVLFAHAEAGHA